MGDLIMVLIKGWFPENNVFLFTFQQIDSPFNTLEPNQFNYSCSVRKLGDQPLRFCTANKFSSDNLSLYLNINKFRIDFSYFSEFSSVNITKRIMSKQIAE